MLTYPPEFVRAVEEEYRERPDVVFLARENRYILGRILAEGASMRMTPEEVASKIRDGDSASVLDDASAAIRRRHLHTEWMRIVLREISCVRESTYSGRRRTRQPSPLRSVRASDSAAPVH